MEKLHDPDVSTAASEGSGPSTMEWGLISACFSREGSLEHVPSTAAAAEPRPQSRTRESALTTLDLRRASRRQRTAPTGLAAAPKRSPDPRKFASAPVSRSPVLTAPELPKPAPQSSRAMTVDLQCPQRNRQSKLIPAQCLDSFAATYSVVDGQVLGKSLTGISCKAEHKETGQIVGVKTSYKAGCSDVTWSVLQTGTQVHRQQKHPNIVRLDDVYETETCLVHVTADMTGVDLSHALQERGKFSEPEAANVLRQMLRAVDHLHERDVMHRDIKLDNFRFESPDSDVVKLIDLSTATSWDGIERLTLKCGTVDYAAPELLRGSYTEKVDMRSMGVVAYMLLTGEHVYTGTSWDIWAKARTGQPDIAAKLFGLSYDAQDFILSLLVSKPSERMSADEALSHPWLG